MSPFGYVTSGSSYPQQFQEGAGYAFPQGVFPPYGPQGFPAQPGMFVPPVGTATPGGMYPGYPPAAFGPTQAAQAAGGFPGGPSMMPSAPQPAGVAGVGAGAQPFGFQQMQGGQSQGFQGTGEQQQMGGASQLAGGPGAQPNPGAQEATGGMPSQQQYGEKTGGGRSAHADSSRVHAQAASAVERIMRANETRRGGCAVKGLTLAEGNVAKRATHAVTCETLRYLPVIKDLIAATGLANSNWMKAKPHLVYVLVYDLVVSGKGTLGSGAVQKVVLSHKAALRAALARLLVKQRAASVEELLGPSSDPPVAAREPLLRASEHPAHQHTHYARFLLTTLTFLFPPNLTTADPRYARVNTLRTNTQAVLTHFQTSTAPGNGGSGAGDDGTGSSKSGGDESGGGKSGDDTSAVGACSSAGRAAGRAEGEVALQRDELIPDVLVFPAGTELHRHPLVEKGELILQGRASCFPAFILAPRPGWHVLDACAAPGNKTSHVAALMENTGRLVACERDAKRAALLRKNLDKAGVTCARVHEGDFLAIDPTSPEFADVRAILLDPSCSGSGTRHSRGDLLVLPESTQNACCYILSCPLLPLFTVPAAQRITYSTCSVNERENEAVVAAVLPAALSRGFRLAAALPAWPRRGLPSYPFGHQVVRTDPAIDGTDGFFVALFERQVAGAADVAGDADMDSRSWERGHRGHENTCGCFSRWSTCVKDPSLVNGHMLVGEEGCRTAAVQEARSSGK
ncbi:unnamed protein product [Closterium sp. Naga37s-1]|nr:unnamed protein product [Closterium sp. Naga37s-1]